MFKIVLERIPLTFALTRVRLSLPYRAAVAVDFEQFCLVATRINLLTNNNNNVLINRARDACLR